MTKLKKILDKFHANPAGLRFAQIEKSLISYGCKKVPAKGSHVKFKHHLAESDLIIPVHKNECKVFYKKSALKFIKDNNLHIHYEYNNQTLHHHE